MPFLDRVGLIAHELAHVSQMEMRRGGTGAAAHWIREGHAEWVKFQVFEWLGLRPYAVSHEEVRRSVLRSSTPITLFPDLVDLAGDGQWDEARNRLGSAATYGQAFLAVDWLVERYGIETLHAFFRRFALGDQPGTNWGRVYPIPFRQFTREFRIRLGTLGGLP